MKRSDLAGKRFSKLTVISYAYSQNKRAYWNCHCDCGNNTIVAANHLKNGHTQSCGCHRKGLNLTHGMSRTALYSVWDGIKQRCMNPNNPGYQYYGARGISICEEWLDYNVFFNWAMENGYNKGLSIDRINVNGGYCPQNCRWTTTKIQARNTRRNIYLTYNGETKILKDWAYAMNVNYNTLRGRYKRGYSPYECLFGRSKEISK